MKSQKYLATLCALSSLICVSLNAVIERDWMNDWFTPELPGTQELPSIGVDEIENYSIAVTYALDGGRFGDQLTNYAKALWISWKYNLPLIYRPFDYSDQLVLSDVHRTTLNERVIKSFSAKFGYYSVLELEKAAKVFSCLGKETNRQNDKKPQLLWNIGLLTPFIEEHFCEKFDDAEFRSLLQKLVKPKGELALISPPTDRKSVAIHVRTGIGYDLEVNIRNMPTKFPPESFYLAGLKQAAIYFEEQPLYVYIFTDHPEPALIEDKILKALNIWGIKNDVLIECRRSGNTHTRNVLEDLFSMTQFDCVIHPDSSLSRFAALISAPILEIKPSHWAECRKSEDGSFVLDKQKNVIVDPLVIERVERGKEIRQMFLSPIESSVLFE